MTRFATILAFFSLLAGPTFAQLCPSEPNPDDCDGDGIDNTFEMNGYRYGANGYEFCTVGTSSDCFRTDFRVWSSDGDPYSDGQEASQLFMDTAVPYPYDTPVVAAYPVIEVKLSSYTFDLNSDITDGQGGELYSSETYTTETSSTSEHTWSVGAETDFGGLSVSAEYSETHSRTQSYGRSEESGRSFNWESVREFNTANAAVLNLNLRMRNTGSAVAASVRPTFNVLIGGEIVRTVATDLVIGTLGLNADVAFNPTVEPIPLTLRQLANLELGAPVEIRVVQVEANIERWNEETSLWDCGSGGEFCPWSSFQQRIDATTFGLRMDFGYSGDPSVTPPPQFATNPYYYRVYSGNADEDFPGFTLRDMIRFAGWSVGATDAIAGRPFPETWYLTERRTFINQQPIYQAWLGAGEPGTIIDVVMPTFGNLLMASPDPDDAGPIVTSAAFSENLLSIRATANPKGSLPVVAADAHVVQYGGGEHVVPMALSADGTAWTTETAGPFLLPGGVASSYVVFTDLSGATRRTADPLGLPFRSDPLAVQCEDVDLSNSPDNPVLPGFDALLFPGADLDTPVEVYCDSDGVEEYYWVPKETNVGSNGLYGVTFVDERTAVAVGNQTIIRSTDGGRTWNEIDVDGLTTTLWDIDRNPDTGTLVAVEGDDSGKMFRSTDDGLTWTLATPTFSGTTLAVGHAFDGRWYAVGENGVKVSIDDGLTWADDPNAPAQSGTFVSVEFRDAQTGILLDEGTGTGGTGRIWRTTDGGQTWTNVFTATSVSDVVYAGDDAWYVSQNLVSDDRVLRSRQNGDEGSWDVLDIGVFGATSPRSISFASPDLGFVAGSSGVLRTDDGGETWTREPLPDGSFYRAVATYDVNRGLAVGGFGRIALTTSGGGFPTAVPVASEDGPPTTVPLTFRLDSAYPNPFRARTTIAFMLGASGEVSLDVYDVLGRRVARLVDEPKSAGSHTVPFDGHGLASGVYVVRLLVGDRAETRRITLVR